MYISTQYLIICVSQIVLRCKTVLHIAGYILSLVRHYAQQSASEASGLSLVYQTFRVGRTTTRTHINRTGIA